MTKQRSVQHYGSGNSSAVHKHKQMQWTRFSTHLSVRGLYAQCKTTAVGCFFYSLGKLSEKCRAAGISVFPTWIRCWVAFVYFVALCSIVLFRDCDFRCVYTDLKSASSCEFSSLSFTVILSFTRALHIGVIFYLFTFRHVF